MRRVVVADGNSTRYTVECSEVEYRRPLFGDTIITPTSTVTLDNQRGEFNWFQTVDVSDPDQRVLIQIWNDTRLEFDGFLTSYTIDEFTNVVSISITHRLAEKLNRMITYQSEYATTPALVLQELCEIYKIPYDLSNFSQWHTYFEGGNDPFHIEVSSFATRPLAELFADVCSCGLISLYYEDGLFRMDAWRDDPLISIGTLGDKSLYEYLTVTQPEKEICNGFTVKYIDGEYTEGQFDNAGGLVLDQTSEVRVLSLPTAVLIANRWLAWLNYRTLVYATRLPRRVTAGIGLGTILTIRDYVGRITMITRGNLELDSVEIS